MSEPVLIWQIELAERWANEIGLLYSGYHMRALKQQLSSLLTLFVQTLTNDPFQPKSVSQIGVELVKLGFTQTATLETTLEILQNGILSHLPYVDWQKIYPRLMTLLTVVAVSYHAESLTLAKEQQEIIRLAMMPDTKKLKRISEILAPTPSSAFNLSNRQAQILTLITRNKTTAEIAKALDIKQGTVSQHLNALYKVLEVKTREEARLKAVEMGII